ncbi:MAG: sensor domain-containing diguanylate cyclase [Spirochaetes bacterium]|nr:sensor domain-containing diguanylate cyclase [Spirochaetota bacterium]
MKQKTKPAQQKRKPHRSVLKKTTAHRVANYELKKVRKQLKRKNRGFIIIRDLADLLRGLEPSQNEILDVMMIRFAIEAVAADRGSLLAMDKSKNKLYYKYTFTYRDGRLDLTSYSDKLIGIEYGPGESLAGICIDTKEIITVDDVQKDTRYQPRADRILKVKARSVVCIPLTVQGDVVNVVELVRNAGGPPFDDEDIETLKIITNFAATTMENSKLFVWAITDSLTKISNIHYFMKQFESEVKRSKRYNTNFSLLVLDVDNFKTVNDTYGHQVGDQVLQHLSNILVTSTRDDIDIPARYGGDEFVVMLPSTSKTDAKFVAQKIMNEVRAGGVTTDTGTVQYSVSIGISTFPEDGETTTTLFEAGDKALYKSKNAGKNTLSTLT